MSRLVVGIVGPAGSGKTVVAKRLESHGFTRMRFAHQIKAMLKVGLGLTDAQLDGDEKMVPLAEFGGCTPRHIMQTLGTDWGRRMVDGDIWTNAWRRAAAKVEGPLVVDDVRFPNEAVAVRAAGGVLWRVVRPGLAVGEHLSERLLDSIECDRVIVNDVSLTDLIAKADAALADEGPGR